MMSRFVRPFGTRRYERLYLIAVEGAVTEPGYFDMFDCQTLKVECLRAKGKSSPPEVLKRMKGRIDRESMREGDEAWLVVDKDRWTDAHLKELHDWAAEQTRTVVKRGLAVSNPKFELWLLLHFEDGARVNTGAVCSNALGRHLPGYDKRIPDGVFTDERIREAVRRAKARDTPPCRDWPRTKGTTVYRLVESLIRPPAEVPAE